MLKSYLVVVAVFAASPAAAAQQLSGRVGLACAGSFYETAEKRLEICAGIIGDPTRSDQSKAFAYANRAGAYYELRKLDLALADANKAVDLWPEYQQAYVIRGTTLGDMGRSREAFADLDKAIAMVGNYAAYLGRGHVRLRVGDFQQALADFNEAGKRAATPSALMGRGYAYIGLGQYDRAENDFSLAIRAAPREPRLWIGRAEARLALGNRAGAGDDVQNAGKVSQASAPPTETIGRIWLTVGEALAHKAEYSAVVAAFDEAVAQAPSGGTYNARCWLRATAGRDLPEALADCDRALDLEPGSAAILDSRGLVRLRSGDLSGAIADLDASLQADPRSADALFARGLARMRSGAVAGGDEDIRAAIALRPDIREEYARYGLTP